MSQNLFFSREIFFEKLVSIDLLGPKKLILSFAKHEQNTLWTFIKRSLAFLIPESTRKSWSKQLLQWKDDSRFLQKFLFSTTC